MSEEINVEEVVEQQDPTVEETPETDENTTREVDDVDDTEVDTDEVEGDDVDDTSEADNDDLSEFLSKVGGKVKYMDKSVEIKDLDDLVTGYQKGLDYERQVEKKTNLENQLKSFDELVGVLYPDSIESTEKLMKALIDSEIKHIETQYSDKYEGDDLKKVLKGDDKYQQLLELDPTKFNSDEEVKNFEEDVKALNDNYGTKFKSYKDLPVEVREKAAESGLSLSESYKLVNFDKILNDKKEQTKKSLMAELSTNKKKTTPKANKNTSSKSYYTLEQIESMSQAEIMKNYDKVMESYKKLQNK